MMKTQIRNLAVGTTVIVALILLGAMILLFTGLPTAFRGGHRLKMRFDSTGDAHEGDPVHLAGVRVGSITDISFTDGDPRRGVTFTALIDRGVRIPGNVAAYIYTKGFVGTAYIVLRPDGEPRDHPLTGKPMEFLPTNWREPIEGQMKPMPDEVTQAIDQLQEGFRDFSKLANNINRLIAPLAGARPTTVPGEETTRLADAVAKFTRTLDDLHKVFGDPENQANFKASLTQLAQATSEATKAMKAAKTLAEDTRMAVIKTSDATSAAVKNISDTTAATAEHLSVLADQLVKNTEGIAELMASIRKTATKIESGKGSAGRLVNDPRLYNDLVEAAEELGKLTKELRKLVQTWQVRGMKIRYF